MLTVSDEQKYVKILNLWIAGFIGVFLGAAGLALAAPVDFRAKEAEFAIPPATQRPWTFWFWVNGNVTKEGITADLEDMQRVGIGGAMLFDGSMYLPPGPVRYGSDEWHDHVQFAIREAARLGIKLGVMNCAGWATAGGPWNSLDQSMKMLVWSEQRVPVDGWNGNLPDPPRREGFYKDIAVLAVRDGREVFDMPTKSDSKSLQWTFEETVRRQLLVLPAREDNGRYIGKLEVSQDGETFEPVVAFDVSSRYWLQPFFITFPETEGKVFRVSFTQGPIEKAVNKVLLSNAVRLPDLVAQSGMTGEPPGGFLAADRNPAAVEVLDLTEKVMQDGSLDWLPPSEGWTVLRFGFTTTGAKNHPAVPEGTGWEVDKFDPKAVAHHFENGVGRIIQDAGDEAGKALAAVLFDSWEAGPQNWTKQMPELFKAQRGYAMEDFMATLAGRVVGSWGESNAFLRDFRKTLGELYAEKFYGTFARLTHEHGMLLIGEGYGGVLDEFRVNAELDIPAVEFWNHQLYKSFGNVTSVAHTTGKNVVMAEAFTSRPPEQSRWQETPANLKVIGDVAFAQGVNCMVLHSYVHQPRSDIAPGFTHGRYGTNFGRLNSWWPLAGSWIDYLRRCQFMLQQGRPVAELLFLVPRRLQREDRSLEFPWDHSIRGDYLAMHQLKDARVEEGRIRVGADASYAALVLPGECPITLDEFIHLQRLREEGADIRGPFFPIPGGLQDVRSEDWSTLEKQWQGSVSSLDAWSGEPQFDGGPELNFFQRRVDGADIFFVSNPGTKPVNKNVRFRTPYTVAEIWDPMRGDIQAVVSESVAGSILVPLHLSGYGSCFVVFRDHSERDIVEHGEPDDILVVDGGWQVRFESGRGAPSRIMLEELTSWTNHPDEGVRHFAGVATYQKTLNLEALPIRAVIDLGHVADIAEVRVNGKPVGSVWIVPFTVDVSGYLKQGANDLEIHVANRWVNRLIADSRLPNEAEYIGGRSPSTGAMMQFPVWWADESLDRDRVSFQIWKQFEGDESLVASGLIGPVKLKIWNR